MNDQGYVIRIIDRNEECVGTLSGACGGESINSLIDLVGESAQELCQEVKNAGEAKGIEQIHITIYPNINPWQPPE